MFWYLINLFIFSLGMLVFSSCCLSCATMTAPTFERIQIGAPVAALEAEAGPPFRMTTDKSGNHYYHYLERIQIGPETTCQNTYIITIKEGQVVDKQQLQDSSSFNVQVR